MEENFKCECGNEKFWFFWNFVRCTKCFNEYKRTQEDWNEPELWLRRFNKKKNQYNLNWEHSKITYKK